jgi:hypothetical protein
MDPPPQKRRCIDQDQSVPSTLVAKRCPVSKRNAAFLRYRIDNRCAPSDQEEPSRHLAPDFAFGKLEADALLAERAMRTLVSAEEAGRRMQALDDRGLTTEKIAQQLKVHQRELEASLYGGVLATGEVCEGEVRTIAKVKVLESVFQHYKVLHRRKLSVLDGAKLAPMGSVFAQAPFGGRGVIEIE